MQKILLFITMVTVAFSAPAFKGEMKFKQEDNSTFTGELKGDEWFSWVEDKEGNIIKYNFDSKDYEYAQIAINNGVADLVPSGSKVIEEKDDNGSANLSASSPIQAIKIDKKILAKIWDRKRKEALIPK